jgi:prevent-host-death family protein
MSDAATKSVRQVGIRELKTHLSRWVQEVKQGSTVVVTEHGRPVARLVPEPASFDDRVHALRASGLVQWSGRRLGKPAPRVPLRGRASVAELLIEDRG